MSSRTAREAIGTTEPSSSNVVPSSDLEFDAIYDERMRAISPLHWTPLVVAARAARLLAQAGATRILDVGSGVGKFCIVGALSTAAQFVGIERREHLVHIARGAASRLGATRATFIQADVATFSFEGFDGVYLYNPFHEQISPHLPQIDATLERSEDAYDHFVQRTTDKLASRAAPVAVVTYNGFGGVIPRSYTFLGGEPAGSDRLERWIKLMR
jgi:predicted RNA methylase